MQEPIAGAVPLQAMELALEDDLDAPRSDRSRPATATPPALDARRRFIAAFGCRRESRLAMSAVLPLRPHMPRHEVERGLADQPDILRGACGIQRAEVRDDHGSVGLLQRDQVSGRIDPKSVKRAPEYSVGSRVRVGSDTCMNCSALSRCDASSLGTPGPSGRSKTHEPDAVRRKPTTSPAGPDLDPGDGRGLPAHDAVRFEMKLR